jgi:hypothetical protein
VHEFFISNNTPRGALKTAFLGFNVFSAIDYFNFSSLLRTRPAFVTSAASLSVSPTFFPQPLFFPHKKLWRT